MMLGACATSNSRLDAITTSAIERPLQIDTVPAAQIDNTPQIEDGPKKSVFGSVEVSFQASQQLDTRLALLAEGDIGLLDGHCGDALLCSGTLGVYRNSLAGLRRMGAMERLQTVNSLVNRTLTYAEDGRDHGRLDQWQSFVQSVHRGSGDCEDFAIAKRALLREAGVPGQDMFVTVVKDQSRDRHHAVLVVRSAGSFYILDNQRDAVLTDKMFPQYMPLYSVGHSRIWLHGKQGTSGANLGAIS